MGKKISNQNYRMTINFNPALFKVLLRYLKPKKEERILDLGCSRGFYVKKLEPHVKKIIGVDKSTESLKEAVSPKIQYGDATDLDFENNAFDKIYSLHTIEHIANLKLLFREVARVLKPGGTAIFIYPWELIRGVQAVWAAIKQYKNPFIARKIHLHRLTPDKVKKIIKNTNLVHLKSKFIFALGFHFITILQRHG